MLMVGQNVSPKNTKKSYKKISPTAATTMRKTKQFSYCMLLFLIYSNMGREEKTHTQQENEKRR